MEISRKDLATTFTKLKVNPVDCSHHRRGFVCDEEGRPMLPIYYSPSKPLRGKAARSFLKDLLLSEAEFRVFARCKISRSEYLLIAKERL